MKSIISFLFLLLSVLMILGCSSNPDNSKPTAVQPDSSAQETIVQRSVDTENVNPQSPEELLPYPWYVNHVLFVFTDAGIDSYYALNKHVPATFQDYIDSGIPFLIPNDYVSGEPYHLVSAIDSSDTSGFTFESDGVDNCTFEFVIKDKKSGTNRTITKKFDSNHFNDYKDGILANNIYYFDKVKREYSVRFFNYYSSIYLHKNHTAPSSFIEMFKDEGTPIEAGWKWTPEAGSNEYFEFGVDAPKLRFYHIQTSTRMPADKASVVVQQMHEEIRPNHEPIVGEDTWSFPSKNEVTPDVINLNMFVSSDNMYQKYGELVKA